MRTTLTLSRPIYRLRKRTTLTLPRPMPAWRTRIIRENAIAHHARLNRAARTENCRQPWYAQYTGFAVSNGLCINVFRVVP